MISVVVNSLNEGKKLKECLGSVKGWANEIIVVDMESNDETKDVAEKFNAKRYIHRKLDYVEPARAFAVSKTSGQWILILDPDEQVGDELKERLTKVASEDIADAVNIPRLNFIFGKKIKHTNFWPDRHIRFFKKEKVAFSNMIHSYPKVEGKVLRLESNECMAIRHYPYKDVAEYLERMKRYSSVEAKNLFERGIKFSFRDLITKPLYDFLRRYLWHKGFLDGFTGLLLSVLQAYYYFQVELKLRSLGKK